MQGSYDTGLTKRKKINAMLSLLKDARSNIEPMLEELAAYVLPDRLRLLVSDTNQYNLMREFIVDGHATRESRTLQSGMVSGMSSQSKSWYRITTPHPSMQEIPGVKNWLYGTTEAMRFVHSQSNFYQISPMVYEDMGTFATGATLVERDINTVIHLTHFPMGSYWIASDWRGKTNTFSREFQMTVLDLIEKFGLRDNEGTGDSIDWDKLSPSVKSQWENGHAHRMIDVTHVIYPNYDHRPGKLDAKYKKFSSCYFETGNDQGDPESEERYLRESGYDYFPVLAPKWSLMGNDWWGTGSPGMLALPDIKMLQKMQSRKLQAIDKMADPPMTGPTKLRKAVHSTMPGRRTYIDIHQGQKGFEPTYMVDPRILEVRQDIMEVKEAISEYYFSQVFIAMMRDQRDQRATAREVEEISAEKGTLVGPVVERVSVDYLGPLIDITFYEMNSFGMIPEPPQELRGMPLKIEYISPLAQQQKLIAVGAVDRFIGFITGLAGIDPRVVYKVKTDKLADEYADIIGISPGSLRSEEEFNQILAQVQKAQEAQMRAEQMNQVSGTVKNLAQSEMGGEGENVLDKLSQGARA